MSKIRCYPNLILSDPLLPFTLEISRSRTVYERNKKGEMSKVDSIFMKRQNKIIVNHKGWKIKITGYDKELKKLIYEINKKEKP